VDGTDETQWKYMPSAFEKRRCTLIQLAFAFWYLSYASIGLGMSFSISLNPSIVDNLYFVVMPLVELASVYSKPFTIFVIIFWIFYCAAILFMDTEFNEMVSLNASSISSFTYRLTFGAKPPKCLQCGSRATKLSYADAYPLFSFLYRTPNSTPAEYYWKRRIQGLVAKVSLNVYYVPLLLVSFIHLFLTPQAFCIY
jgi:hypothetical protein